MNGTLYTVTGLGLVAALDPATGHTRWVYDPVGYRAGRPANVGFLQRGLEYVVVAMGIGPASELVAYRLP